MKKNARARIEKFLTKKRGKAFNRSQICKKLKMPRTTVYDNLHILELKGVVQKYTKSFNPIGRPHTMWYIPKE